MLVLPEVPGTPGDADTRSECLVVGLRQAVRNARVSRNDQARRSRTRVSAVGFASPDLETRYALRVQLAGIDRRVLSRAEGLHMMADVGDRSVEFPAQTVVQGQVRFDLPTVLRKEIERGAADILDLGGTLTIRTGKPEQVVGENWCRPASCVAQNCRQRSTRR